MVTEKSIAIVGQDSCGFFIKFSVGGSGQAEICSGRTAKKNIWKSFRYIFLPVIQVMIDGLDKIGKLCVPLGGRLMFLLKRHDRVAGFGQSLQMQGRKIFRVSI